MIFGVLLVGTAADTPVQAVSSCVGELPSALTFTPADRTVSSGQILVVEFSLRRSLDRFVSTTVATAHAGFRSSLALRQWKVAPNRRDQTFGIPILVADTVPPGRYEVNLVINADCGQDAIVTRIYRFEVVVSP